MVGEKVLREKGTGQDSAWFAARTSKLVDLVSYLKGQDRNIRIAALDRTLYFVKMCAHTTDPLEAGQMTLNRVMRVVAHLAENDGVDYVRVKAQEVLYAYEVRRIPTEEDIGHSQWGGGSGDLKLFMSLVRDTPERK
jgi:hypothetical protein